MKKPVISLTLAYGAGILLGQGFLYFPYSFSVLVIIGILAAGILTLMQRLPVSRTLLFLISCLAGTALSLYSATWLPEDHYTRMVPDNKALHEMTGRIASALDRDIDRTGFVLEMQAIDGRKASGRLRVSIREATSGLGYGDVVRFSGKLFKPGQFKNPGGFDYAAHLARSGIYRTATVKNSAQLEIVSPGAGIFRTTQDWRERIRQAFLVATSGPGSAILQAMVLGEEGGLTDEMRDWFLAAGVTHIISISGSHLGMVAVLCFGLIRLLMRLLPETLYHRMTIYADPGKIAAWLTLPLVVFYTLLAGGQVATVRSLMMITAALAALILDRENALIHSLAAAALLILAVSPQALFDISFQLSFISVLTIGFVVMLWSDIKRNFSGKFGKLAESAVLLILISLSASIATGPLVVHYFNQVSFAGILSNMIVVPFAGMLVVPVGLLSGILSLFTDHLPLAALNQFLADRFIAFVLFFSRLPMAEFHPRSPGIFRLLSYAVLVISLFRIVRARLLFAFRPLEFSSGSPRNAFIAVGLSSVVLLIFSMHSFFPKQSVEIFFPDVGQGDSAFIRFPGNRNILIDGGGTNDGRFDIGRRVLAPYLWNRGVSRLDLVILSHPHPDHMNGLKFILNKFEVSEIWTHGQDTGLAGYEDFNRIIAKKRINHTIASPCTPAARFGEAELNVLHPEATFRSPEKKAYAAENDRSLVVRIAFGNRSLLFTGDIGKAAEKALVSRGGNLKSDLLKVPHHGSKSSSSDPFVAAVGPSLAIIPVGRENRYHHPSLEVVDRYERVGAGIYRTDRDGALEVEMDDRAVQVTAWSDLELKRIPFTSGERLAQERQNWKRLWIRKWEL